MPAPQPFAYQQSSHSCWITSVHNALLFLFGNTYKVPHRLSRALYHRSSDDGVSDDDLNDMLRLFGEINGLKVVPFRHSGITRRVLRRHLKKNNAVLVCDIHGGRHSVLITEIRGDRLIAFDPNWDNVTPSRRDGERYECCPFGDPEGRLLNPHHNVSINMDWFFAEHPDETDRFVMGPVKKRFASFMVRC